MNQNDCPDQRDQDGDDKPIQCLCHVAVQIGTCDENCDRLSRDKAVIEEVPKSEFKEWWIKCTMGPNWVTCEVVIEPSAEESKDRKQAY